MAKVVPSKKASSSSKKVGWGQPNGPQHVTGSHRPTSGSMPKGDQARAAIIEEAIKQIVMGSKNPASRCPDPAAKRQKITISSTEIPDPFFLCFRTEVMKESQEQAGLDFANGGPRQETHDNKGRMLGAASGDIPEYPDGDHDGSHAMRHARRAFVNQLQQNTTAPPSPSHAQPLLRHVVIVPDSPSSLHQPPSRDETPGSVSMGSMSSSMWSGRETPQMQDCCPGMAHAQVSSFQEIRNISQTTQRESEPETWPQHGGAMDSKIISLRLERDALRSALEMSRMREESSFQMLQELRSQLLDAYRIMGRSAFESKEF